MAPSPYTKPFLTVDAQLRLLEQRGLRVADRGEALRFLTSYNYYRLAGYRYHFEAEHHPAHRFRPHTSFDDVRTLCEFDDALCALVFGALRRVEICLRTRLAYHLAQQQGTPFPHLDGAIYRDKGQSQQVCEELRRSAARRVQRESTDPQLRHFQQHYDGFPNLPVWVVVEVASFGVLSRLYSSLRPSYQKPVARSLGLGSAQVLVTWLKNLTQVRNQCAHQGRLWDLRLPGRVAFPQTWVQTPRPERIFASLLCIHHLIHSWDAVGAMAWRDEVNACIDRYLSSCPLAEEFAAHMGLSAAWRDHPVWRDDGR